MESIIRVERFIESCLLCSAARYRGETIRKSAKNRTTSSPRYWRSQPGFELSRINEATRGNVGKAPNYATVVLNGEATTGALTQKASKTGKVGPHEMSPLLEPAVLAFPDVGEARHPPGARVLDVVLRSICQKKPERRRNRGKRFDHERLHSPSALRWKSRRYEGKELAHETRPCCFIGIAHESVYERVGVLTSVSFRKNYL